MLSAPPATVIEASPSFIICAQEMIDCTPEPHSRLSVSAGVVTGISALSMATRAMNWSFGPVCMTWPMTTCSTSAGLMPARPIASVMTRAPRSAGRNGLSEPPKSPMAVRTALTM